MGNYSAWIKSTENDVIKMRDDSFNSTGISVKGLPCCETIKPIAEYLTQVQPIFRTGIDDRLVK